MNNPLTVYALDNLNAGRGDPNQPARADQRLFIADDIHVAKVAEHVDPATKALTSEVKVTLLATGSVVYLPLPAGYADPGHTAVVASAATDSALTVDGETVPAAEVTVPDDLSGLDFKALKALAGDLGLSKGGSAAQLIARISEHKASTAGE